VTVGKPDFDTLQKIAGVSRETYEDLIAFSDLLTKWNRSINLVSPGSIPELWDRHILDSAQLFPMIDESVQHVVDIGTGGGLPGLVLAILFKHHAPQRQMTLIESDKRKCAFLLTVSTTLQLNTTVIAKRIEEVERVTWSMDLKRRDSKTTDDAVVLDITNLRRR